MEIISKKIEKFKVRLSNEEDRKNILDFHKNQFAFSRPSYLKSTLESQTGLSIVAYENYEVEGHILLLPLTSKHNFNLENGALVTGIWCKKTKIAQQLIKEAMMCAWEAGFQAVFSFEKHQQLKEYGFERVTKNFFSDDVSKYIVYGMELSWDAFNTIPNDFTIPETFLPPTDKLNHFSKN